MTLIRSLRGQFVLLLIVLALPVGGMGYAWVRGQDHLLQTVRDQAAGRSVELIAERLRPLELPTAASLSALETGDDGDLPDRCQKLAANFVSRAEIYHALTLFRSGKQLCAATRPGVVDSRPTEISWTALGLAPSDTAAFLAPREPGGSITVATRASIGPSHVEWIALRSLGRPALENLLSAGLSSEVASASLMDAAGNLIAEHHDKRAGSEWLPDAIPRNLNTVSATALETVNHDGYPRRYAALRSLDGVSILVGLVPNLTVDQPNFLRGRAAQILFIFVLTLAAAAWSSDRLFLRWIISLRDLAKRHSRGQSDARFINCAGVPLECSSLGDAIDTLADSAQRQAAFLNTVSAEKLKLLEELHHRVGNNFQVLESLLSLQRMMAAPVHKEDIRFIDEHLHAVAVAHRLSFSSDTSAHADLERLIIEVANGLRLSADLSAVSVEFNLSWGAILLSVDDAIVIALYMAASLPPYLDLAKQSRAKVTIRGELLNDTILLAISGISPPPEPAPFIRMRLSNAYLLQLGGKPQTGDDPNELVALIPRRRLAFKSSLRSVGN